MFVGLGGAGKTRWAEDTSSSFEKEKGEQKDTILFLKIQSNLIVRFCDLKHKLNLNKCSGLELNTLMLCDYLEIMMSNFDQYT